ncbi:MAG: IS1595 family transposase, partial [Steroidobacteraceae bacterium]
QYRFNRRFDLSSIMRRLLVASILTTPRPEQFLRAAEHCG